ncbi:MAG TPA: alanine--tRNA ligase [Nitrospirae bacterium]|nr:alanine--tRNA ligase [Nitrospirota bacterium]
MTSKDIRQQFLNYFHSKEHKIVESSSLIPINDPTLLFTNAGMVQFKSVFLGEEKRDYKRATTCQKCMRAGGKHSDLENVGHTARHHTFFEMLGNFSFGDYFKREAIQFAWELLVHIFKLPSERLWVSVYEDDDEAERLWIENSGITSDRIVRLGAKDNFWQMGDTGPCGPCSEIIIDQGDFVGCKKNDCKVGCDCDRFLELWNLVFMQFNRDLSGNLTALPKPSIDTGMGLERICSVLQGKFNNYDTDLFSPIMSSLESISGIKYNTYSDTDISFRVIADHMRSSVFLLSDGVMPSNEGRGYVLRRIIRRASRHAKLLGLDSVVLYKLTDAVIEIMGENYPEIVLERERTQKILKHEEERFTKTLEQGMRLLDDLISKLQQDGQSVIPGEEIFKLYDTFGFPPDLARDMALDKKMSIDEQGFNNAMEGQRERARASWIGEEIGLPSYYKELVSEIGETIFTGYNLFEDISTVRAILKDGKRVDSISEGEEAELFLDKSPFYGESGGQVGDKGTISVIGNLKTINQADVINCTKKAGLLSHKIIVRKGFFKVFDNVICKINTNNRYSTQRNHTATHLLHRALKLTLGEHVKQAGSLVSPDRLRFDFTHFYQLEDTEIQAIEEIVNERILENIKVETEQKPLNEALKEGVTALFDEKYGDTVRVVKVSDFSAELCGGTHCKATGDIGLFTIISEGSVASGIRRIEALTGKRAFEYLRNSKDELKKVSEILKTDNPLNRLEKLLTEIREKDRIIEQINQSKAVDLWQEALKNSKSINGATIVSFKVQDIEQKDLRILADKIKEKSPSSLIFLASIKDNQASLLCMVSKDLTKKLSAGKILSEIAKMAGGKGGGKDEMAQGGTKDIDRLDEAMNNVFDLCKELLTKS